MIKADLQNYIDQRKEHSFFCLDFPKGAPGHLAYHQRWFYIVPELYALYPIYELASPDPIGKTDSSLAFYFASMFIFWDSF